MRSSRTDFARVGDLGNTKASGGTRLTKFEGTHALSGPALAFHAAPALGSKNTGTSGTSLTPRCRSGRPRLDPLRQVRGLPPPGTSNLTHDGGLENPQANALRSFELMGTISRTRVVGVWVAVTLFGCVGSGCVTYYEQELTALEQRRREDLRLLQERVRTVEGRIEGMELELQRIATELESVRRLAASSGDASLKLVQPKLQELEQRLARLDAAREADRQAIVDELSRRVADLLKRATPPTPARTATTSASRRPGVSTGYEHVVQPNETLSAIAAAYGVSVKTIQEANNIPDPSKLRAGQKLFIPER